MSDPIRAALERLVELDGLPDSWSPAGIQAWDDAIAAGKAALAGATSPPHNAEGEVAELGAALQADAECLAAEQPDLMQMTDKQLARAAELLQQQHPTPVPVSERLPGPGDCDAEGRCWLFSKVEKEWRLINAGNPGVPHLKYCFSHWLPATALPLPQGEVK